MSVCFVEDFLYKLEFLSIKTSSQVYVIKLKINHFIYDSLLEMCKCI